MRYAVTLVFEVGGGKVPRGAGVLSRMANLRAATHRFSYCDGRTLCLVVDWTAGSAEQAGDEAVSATRRAWRQVTGADPGEPLGRQVRPLRAARIPAGLRSAIERVPGVLVQSGPKPGGRPHWRRVRDDGDDDGGLAGVREPRRPKPAPPHLSAALREPGDSTPTRGD